MTEIEIILKEGKGMNLLVDPLKNGKREYTEKIHLDLDKKGDRINGRVIDTQSDADKYLNLLGTQIFYFKKKGSNYSLYKDQIENIIVHSE